MSLSWKVVVLVAAVTVGTGLAVYVSRQPTPTEARPDECNCAELSANIARLDKLLRELTLQVEALSQTQLETAAPASRTATSSTSTSTSTRARPQPPAATLGAPPPAPNTALTDFVIQNAPLIMRRTVMKEQKEKNLAYLPPEDYEFAKRTCDTTTRLIAERYARDNTVIFTTVTGTYPYLLWVTHFLNTYNNSMPEWRPLVICATESTWSILRAAGIQCVLHWDALDMDHISQPPRLKWQYAMLFLGCGYNILFSDLDVAMLRPHAIEFLIDTYSQPPGLPDVIGLSDHIVIESICGVFNRTRQELRELIPTITTPGFQCNYRPGMSTGFWLVQANEKTYTLMRRHTLDMLTSTVWEQAAFNYAVYNMTVYEGLVFEFFNITHVSNYMPWRWCNQCFDEAACKPHVLHNGWINNKYGVFNELGVWMANKSTSLI